MRNFDDVSFDEALSYWGSSVDALLIADREADKYRALARKGVFKEIIDESGAYSDVVETLWFHFNKSEKSIADEYKVFIPNLGKFVGKYSKRLQLSVNNATHIVQMTIQPIEGTGLYLFALDELDEKESRDVSATEAKVSTIQNIYLFSMIIDLTKDTTSSMSLTEVSDETMNSQISYSAWRQMIVNMIWPNDQAKFMELSDPEYLRSNFKPGDVSSFDCQMQNLEGVYIWVKLIFSRMDAASDNDYRFVYMVQNIHDSTVSMRATLKHYEELASRDPLTQIFNHGRIENEICTAIENSRKSGESVALLMLDIDYFKNVNDAYGHAVGDATLTKFASVISDFVKERKAACGRWGGEEFAVVVYGAQPGDLVKLAEELRLRVSSESFETIGSITCSIGATMLEREDTFDAFFDRADKALYAAKSEGRNRVCVE